MPDDLYLAQYQTRHSRLSLEREWKGQEHTFGRYHSHNSNIHAIVAFLWSVWIGKAKHEVLNSPLIRRVIVTHS